MTIRGFPGFPAFGDSTEVYDLAEPILAWRWWSRTAPDPLLASWMTTWIPEGNTATCRQYWRLGGHDAAEVPSLRCADEGFGHGCGFYALKTAEDALKNRPYDYRVLGQVLLAGRVIEHEHGYRAQKAKVAGICHWSTVGLIAANYNVPVLDWPGGYDAHNLPPLAQVQQ